MIKKIKTQEEFREQLITMYSRLKELLCDGAKYSLKYESSGMTIENFRQLILDISSEEQLEEYKKSVIADRIERNLDVTEDIVDTILKK